MGPVLREANAEIQSGDRLVRLGLLNDIDHLSVHGVVRFLPIAAPILAGQNRRCALSRNEIKLRTIWEITKVG